MSARTKEDIKRTLAAWPSITVQNLHPSVTVKDLHVIFQHCGPIKDYFMAPNRRGQGFVAFECEDDADEAVKLDGITFRNNLKVRRFDPLDMVSSDDEKMRYESDRGPSSRHFRPAFDKNRDQCTNVYVTNLPSNSTEERLKAMFEKFGEITSIHMPRNESMPHVIKGFACINFKEAPSAMRAIRIGDGCNFEGKRLKVNKFIYQKERDGPSNAAVRPKKKSIGRYFLFSQSVIVVRNLDLSVKEEELLDEFAKFTKPVWASIFKRDYELSAASAFINFGTPEETADVASRYPALNMFGRQIYISVASPDNDDKEPDQSRHVTYYDPNKHRSEERPTDQFHQVHQPRRNDRPSFRSDNISRQENFHQHGAVRGTFQRDEWPRSDNAEPNRVADRKGERYSSGPSRNVDCHDRAAHNAEASWSDVPQEPSHESSSWTDASVGNQGSDWAMSVDPKPLHQSHHSDPFQVESSWSDIPDSHNQGADWTLTSNSAPRQEVLHQHEAPFRTESSWDDIPASQHGSDWTMTVNPAPKQQGLRLMLEQQAIEMGAAVHKADDGENDWGDQGPQSPWCDIPSPTRHDQDFDW
jgi:RNA recognition motif-containing protein